MRYQVYMVVNSPGEMAGWARPVALELTRRGCSVSLVIPPCQYASGGEEDLCAAMGYRSYRLGRFILDRPWLADPSVPARLLRLGWDLKLTALLGSAGGLVTDAYVGAPRTARGVRTYLTPDWAGRDALASRGVNAVRVGYPIFDLPLKTRRFHAPRPVVFMVGSRPFEALHALPFMVEVAWTMAQTDPGMLPVFPLARTLDPDVMGRLLASLGEVDRPQRPGLLAYRGVPMAITWDGSLPEGAFLWVALPGTNNLEAVSLGVPLLVLLPLNRAWEIPLDGILGMIPAHLPGLRGLKKWLISRAARRLPHVSLPNRILGRRLVPEMVGDLEPRQVARRALEIMGSPLGEEMRRAFLQIRRENLGASRRIAQVVTS